MEQRCPSGFSVGTPLEAVSIPTWISRSQSLSHWKSRQLPNMTCARKSAINSGSASGCDRRIQTLPGREREDPVVQGWPGRQPREFSAFTLPGHWPLQTATATELDPSVCEERDIGACPSGHSTQDALPGSPDGLRLLKKESVRRGLPAYWAAFNATANRHAGKGRTWGWGTPELNVGPAKERSQPRKTRCQYQVRQTRRGNPLDKPGDSGCQGPADPLHL